MPLVETDALILRTYPLSEADKIAVLFTEQHGLIRGVAKGARRMQSRFGGALEPLSIATVEYFQKEERELVNIRRLELRKSFFEAAGDTNFFSKTSYLADLLQSFSPPHEANARLFRMAKICFETAANRRDDLDAIVAYFEIWLLQLAGFLPNWNFCAGCAKDFASNDEAFLRNDFQLICGNCEKGNRDPKITDSQRAIHFLALKTSPKSFSERIAAQKRDVQALSAIYKRIIAQILGRESAGEQFQLASK